MIASKIVPCFCFIKISGALASEVAGINSDIIETFIAVTDQYDNDIDAFTSSKKFIAEVLNGEKADLAEQFNPQFYPSLLKDKTDENKEELENIEEMVEHINHNLRQENALVIPISKQFDELGDHVQSKIHAKNEHSQIEVKIVSNQSHYIQQKAEEHMEKVNSMSILHDTNKLSYH